MANYIDNRYFEQLINQYIVDRNQQIEDQLVSSFNLLIDNIYYSFNFSLDQEDIRQDCFLLVFKILSNFKPEHGSAFNYFTTAIVNNMKLMYTKGKNYNEKMDRYIKFKSKNFEFLEPDYD